MRRFKFLTVIYFFLSISLTGVTSYFDYHHLSSGHNYHKLSAAEKGIVKATILSTVIINPVCILGANIAGGKPRNHKTYRFTLYMFLCIIPSYLFYIIVFGKWRDMKKLFHFNRKLPLK